MALTKCQECGAEVSTKAGACPKCGAKQRRTNAVTKIVGTIFALGVVVAVISSVTRENEAQKKAAEEATRVAALTPEQRQREADAKKAEDANKRFADQMFLKAQLAAQAVRKSANDPASIQFAEAGYTDEGTVYLIYRGKNAFNATILNRAILTADGKAASGSDAQTAALWNRYIAGKPVHPLPKP